MIADLKPYAGYRRAEGEWLGEIPSHWTVRRMKYVVHEIDSRSTTGKEQLLRISQYTGVTQRRRADGLEEPDTRADSLVGYKCVEPNDLVINIMLAWNGSMGVSQYSGIASPAYCVYRFSGGAHPWYVHKLLRSPAYKARIKSSSTGVVSPVGGRSAEGYGIGFKVLLFRGSYEVAGSRTAYRSAPQTQWITDGAGSLEVW